MTRHSNAPRDAGAAWVTCATCWGQRLLLTVSAGGGALFPVTCPGCLGVGERLAGGDQVPAPTP